MAIEISCSEQDIEDFLCIKGNLEKYLGLRLLKRQYRTPVGVVDIVAYNKKTKRFVIIELKKDLLDYKAFFQMERYAHYLKKSEINRCDATGPRKYFLYKNAEMKFTKCTERKFDRLLIGKDISPDLYYSVEHWDDSSDNCHAETWYTLFGFRFDSAISFGYYQPQQSKIECAQYNGCDDEEEVNG